MHFPVAGIDVSPLVPLGVALCVSTLTSMGGISGAFVLLPFQVSVLGFAGPAVTPTNHLFNVVAIPSGVYRYVREGRMLWPLCWIIIAGTLPGVVGGSLARIYVLPSPRDFKLFMGFVLLLIGSRLAHKLITRRPDEPHEESGAQGPTPQAGRPWTVKTLRFDWRRLEYEFDAKRYGVPTPALGALTAAIGVIAGAYGVGGGAIIAPLLVSVFGLPVYTIAGATLLGTCLTSALGVAFFCFAGPALGASSVTPDWALGLLLGAGGLGGMYLGARLQKRVPARAIEALLAVAISALGVWYVVGFFRP